MTTRFHHEYCIDCARHRSREHHPDCVHALAAGSRRTKTAKPVECEASQSGPNASEGNAQKDKS